ncbi:EAL domain-containing protein [Undibacterium sp. Jales W-56]|uniref:putative bifunctional diguanylate cyclase/phosphodiesterase n=1 Tax=Undibacterium sp. Jales W-56 TaxID=2897325 RepID=UPI0021D11B12|nr:bifunctional diguanylate cyclase/phosphodiesterase [Undibacterium sp. Jales W-56]MCU6433566.1 EAL domain-containing protein [Undibacterium sp. Jales W-56]
MAQERSITLDAESQRLERWFLLLGELSDCLWHAQDVQSILHGFCQLLVDKAAYLSADVTVNFSGVNEQFSASLAQIPSTQAPSAPVSELTVALQYADQAIGELRVRSFHDLTIGSEAFSILIRLAEELSIALAEFTHAEDHQNLQESVDVFALALEQSPFGVVITDAAGLFEYCNASFTAMSGYTRQELMHLPVLWANPDIGGAANKDELLALQIGQHWQGEILSHHKDGKPYWERQIVSPLHDPEGRITHLIAVKQDISDYRLQLENVEQALLLREQALVSSSNGIMITRSDVYDHSIVYVNPAFERITGYASEEVIGREGRFLVRDDLAQPDLEEIRTALREKRAGKALLRNYRKNGSLFWNELHIAPVHDAGGAATTHFVSVINDVSDRVTYQNELEYQATHDSLTGLANRNLLNDRIQHAIAWANRENQIIAVMLLDLDHFKLINDASGHGAGDAMLKEVARRLMQCVRDTDTVARLGGDEFVLILTDLREPGDVDLVAEKVLAALSKPFDVIGQDVVVTASIGISFYPRDGDHGEILLRYADIAMYRVKEHGRNSVRQFVPEMGVTAISRLNMEAALRRGLERNEFVLHYQPKISLAEQKIIGAEALVRWQHPQIGMIHPVEFIPLAEQSGLILPLGEWVLAEACRQQVLWAKQGLAGLKIAINMSSRQFRQEELATRVASIFTATGADPQLLILELTESMVMQDVESTLRTLRALKKLGVSISLDDFGTGYSSLSYLRRFPIDELKIDKSFINDIHTNPDDAAIASAIIAMAVSLGLNVVAEGVERKEQSVMLTNMGCHQVQGYYFGRPVDAASFTKRCREPLPHIGSAS